MKVYDGPDNTSAVIGTYCGQQRNLVIYSSESSLFVTFVTLPRTANTQNRGFKGIFEFSNSFTKLGMSKFKSNLKEHIFSPHFKLMFYYTFTHIDLLQSNYIFIKFQIS